MDYCFLYIKLHHFLFIFVSIGLSVSERGSYVYDRLFSDLQRNYNYRVRPYFGEKPVTVTVFLRVANIRSISEQTMDYKMELYYREYWTDPRLAFSPENYENLTLVPMHETMVTAIWIPDTFLPSQCPRFDFSVEFDKSNGSPKDAIRSVNPGFNPIQDPSEALTSSMNRAFSSITHRSLLRLKNDGSILYSRRLSVTAECPMDLTLFPFDEQVCRLSIESYGGDSNSVIYQWRKPSAVVLDESLTLPDFHIKEVIVKARNITLLTGTYSRLECCFVLKRSSEFYITHLFIPASAMVATAWISLRMEKESTFSDMINVMLSITFLYFEYNAVMPKVSYIKAMDIYLQLCFTFVFSALLTLAYLKRLRDEANEYAKETTPRAYSQKLGSEGQGWFRSPLLQKLTKVRLRSTSPVSAPSPPPPPGSPPPTGGSPLPPGGSPLSPGGSPLPSGGSPLRPGGSPMPPGSPPPPPSPTAPDSPIRKRPPQNVSFSFSTDEEPPGNGPGLGNGPGPAYGGPGPAKPAMRRRSVMEERRQAELWQRLRRTRQTAVIAYPVAFFTSCLVYVIWLNTVDKHDSMGNCTF